MHSVACVMLAFALAGCASEDELATRRCAREAYIPAWNKCIESYNAKAAAQKAQEEQQGNAEDATVWGLLGAATVLNSYNQSRPATVTCFKAGMMTQCQ